MTDVPRRLHQSGADKLAVVADRVAPGSHRGITQWSKPPTVKTPTPQSASSGTTLGFASATYQDFVTGQAPGSIGNPATLVRSQGDDSRYFAYNGTNGILLLQAGWYQVAAAGNVGSGTPGDAWRAFCYFTTLQTVEGSDIVNLAGTANPTGMSLPFYDDGSGTVVQVSLENHSGSGGVINGMLIHLVAFG